MAYNFNFCKIFRNFAKVKNNFKLFFVSDKATINIDGESYEFPVYRGVEDDVCIDIKTLRGASGATTIDRGFKNTASCESKITYLDGEKGILRYRGYDLDELANKASFLEVAYLLIFGELPTKTELDKFHDDIVDNSIVNDDVKKIVDAFPSSAHPMGVLSSLTSALTAFNPDDVSLDYDRSKEGMYNTIVKVLGKIPILVGWSYRKKNGLPLQYSMKIRNLDYTDMILHLLFKKPNDEYRPDKNLINVFNKLLILHADHEQNCSTSTVRIVGSSHAGLFPSISAGISALWGPLHGGANQAVLEMLKSIQEDGGNTKKYIRKAKDKNDPFRLMGFGHRVYKNYDPRARIIKDAAHKFLKSLGIDDPLLHIAGELEENALKDKYFIDRKLFPNVDFYSGVIYRAMGIPSDMYTVMFVLGRLPGWIAQWREMRLMNEPIGRPRQLYTGPAARKFKSKK